MTIREALENCAEALENDVIVLKDGSLHMHSCQRYQLGVAKCEPSCEEARAAISQARAALAEPERCVPVERLDGWFTDYTNCNDEECELCDPCSDSLSALIAEYTEREPA